VPGTTSSTGLKLDPICSGILPLTDRQRPRLGRRPGPQQVAIAAGLEGSVGRDLG
jgi:hypothetical protein